MILKPRKPSEFLGKTVEGLLIEEDHVDRIESAWNAFQEVVKKHSLTDWEPEVLGEYDKETDIGGTADFIGWNNAGLVVVGDFKFGKGIQVSPVNSGQGRFYAMACRKDSCVSEFFEGAKRIIIAIIQPNDRGDDVLREWETTSKAIDEFETLFVQTVKKAGTSPAPVLCAGDWCQYCPAAAVCPERTGETQRALQFKPDDLEHLSVNMSRIKNLTAWIKAVESATINQLEVGSDVKGWKLVAKRAMNKWIDEENVITRLRRKMGGKKHMVTEKLLSPAQMQKAAKKLDVEIDIKNLTHKVSSGSTLAAADDKRPAVVNVKTLTAGLASIT